MLAWRHPKSMARDSSPSKCRPPQWRDPKSGPRDSRPSKCRHLECRPPVIRWRDPESVPRDSGPYAGNFDDAPKPCCSGCLLPSGLGMPRNNRLRGRLEADKKCGGAWVWREAPPCNGRFWGGAGATHQNQQKFGARKLNQVRQGVRASAGEATYGFLGGVS